MRSIIPGFYGFYDSIWATGVDDAELSLAQYLTGDPESDAGEGVDGFRGRDVGDVCEALYRVIGYKALFNSIAKAYAEAFAHELDRACKWKTRIAFDSLDSPREYNFSTDRIFVKMPRSTVRRMRKECDPETLARMVKDECTSRSGFISFYSADVAEWGPLDQWDHNQASILLAAWMESQDIDNPQEDIYSAMCENDAFSEFLDRSYVESELLAVLNKKD